MKRFWTKIWVPALLVSVAAIQSFGIDASRAVGLKRLTDSLILNKLSDTISVQDSVLPVDSKLDSTVNLILTAKDTIKVPDSLQFTDPFKYKYYIALKDSTLRLHLRDSLLNIGDSLELHKLDSLYIKDSTEVAQIAFTKWYSSLSRKERKKYDAEQALPGLIEAQRLKMERKDSIKAAKDSIIAEKPRILQTFAVPDSMHYKRIITWNHDRYFHNVELKDFDTTYNYNFHDYPFFKGDAVNSVWLGVVGAPEESFDFFKRTEEENAVFYTPYQTYSYTPDNAPQFNTKTPYTELAYWGTLFANKEKEESNVRILTTQNITPELNFTLEYRRYGSNGMLRREDTDNRSALISTNYMGKRYLMHSGFIYNKVERSENGGIIDQTWIRDTTVDAREIEVRLRNAGNKLKRNTLFLDQMYRIPFSFLKKEKGDDQASDSTAIAAPAPVAADTISIDTDVTTAFIGHSSEYSVFRKTYEDEISISDSYGREFYNDRFYINPTRSMDSLRVMRFENRAFLRLQPWKSDGIVSRLDVGIGDKLLNYYTFNPAGYIQGSSNVVLNSAYLYAGANGKLKKYMQWDAKGQYTFLGHEINDFDINANLSLSVYPFRRDRKSPLTFNAHFETSLKEPDYYQQHLYTNHYRWDNDFSKISTTKAEASLSIPKWQMAASFGYALLSNNIYYDTEGIVRQNNAPMSVMTASLKKNFTVWKLHFDHKALFQLSSNETVMPLPMLALNLRYYLQFDVVKKVMQMQIGANGTYTTQ